MKPLPFLMMSALGFSASLLWAQEGDPITQFHTENGNGFIMPIRRGVQPAPQADKTGDSDETATEPARPVTREESAALLRRLLVMRKKGALMFIGPMFTPEGRLSPQYRALFELTNAEAAAIDDALAQAQARMKQLENGAAAGQLNPQTGDFVILVAPFPEAGGKVYDDVLARLRSVLGAERTRMLLEIAGTQFEQDFGGFGVQSRTYTISHRKSAAGDSYRVYNDVHAALDFTNGGVSSAYASSDTKTYATRAEVIRSLGELGARFLPPDF